MSTKIYNGYRIPQTTLAAWQSTLPALIKDFQAQARELAMPLLVSPLVRKLDCSDEWRAPDLSGSEVEPSSDSSDGPARACDAMDERLLKSFINSAWKLQREPVFDGQCLLMVKPYGEDLLVGLFAENRVLSELAKSVFGLEEFGYWDNTDPDEDCSEEAWAYREKAWEEALGNDSWVTAGFLGLELTSVRFFKDCFIDLQFSNEVIARLVSEEARLNQFVDFAAQNTLAMLQSFNHLPLSKADILTRAKQEREWSSLIAKDPTFSAQVTQYFNTRRTDLNEGTAWKWEVLCCTELWASLRAQLPQWASLLCAPTASN